jgi:hypothetical protein
MCTANNNLMADSFVFRHPGIVLDILPDSTPPLKMKPDLDAIQPSIINMLSL